MSLRRLLLLLLLLSIAAPSASARTISSKKARARSIFNQGVKAFKKGNYPAALTHFMTSYKLRPKSIVVYNIAMCHRALFQYKRSIAAFRKFLQIRGRRIRPGKLKKITRLIPDMQAKLGRITLQVKPQGALVKVDGEKVGTAPLASAVAVDPGKRVVEVAFPGYHNFTRTLELLDGQRLGLTVRLRRILRPGHVVISAPMAGALAVVDQGKPRPLPLSVTLSEGVHQIRVTAPGHRPKILSVTVEGGKLLRQRVTLEPLPKARRDRARPLLRRRILPPRPRPRPHRPPASRTTPFYRTAWFWTLISAAVLGAGATTGYFIWQSTTPDHRYDDVQRMR